MAGVGPKESIKHTVAYQCASAPDKFRSSTFKDNCNVGAPPTPLMIQHQNITKIS
jgi:hypothetical protein